MIKQLGKAISEISNFSVLLFLFIFTYSILGMEWFSNLAKFDIEYRNDLENGISPPLNFDSFI